MTSREPTLVRTKMLASSDDGHRVTGTAPAPGKGKGGMKPLPGSNRPRFPINSPRDVEKAVRALGRAKGNKAAVRRHIVARAKAVGAEGKIPQHWKHDGTLNLSVVARAIDLAAERGVFVDLSQDTPVIIDLAAKWKHGWIPLNAEAEEILKARHKEDGKTLSHEQMHKMPFADLKKHYSETIKSHGFQHAYTKKVGKAVGSHPESLARTRAKAAERASGKATPDFTRMTTESAVQKAERTGHVGNASLSDLAKRRTDAELQHIADHQTNTPEGKAAQAELTRRHQEWVAKQEARNTANANSGPKEPTIKLVPTTRYDGSPAHEVHYNGEKIGTVHKRSGYSRVGRSGAAHSVKNTGYQSETTHGATNRTATHKTRQQAVGHLVAVHERANTDSGPKRLSQAEQDAARGRELAAEHNARQARTNSGPKPVDKPHPALDSPTRGDIGGPVQKLRVGADTKAGDAIMRAGINSDGGSNDITENADGTRTLTSHHGVGYEGGHHATSQWKLGRDEHGNPVAANMGGEHSQSGFYARDAATAHRIADAAIQRHLEGHGFKIVHDHTKIRGPRTPKA